VFRCLIEQQCISACTQDVTPLSFVVILSKFTFENGYKRVKWVDTWVISGNDDMSQHETAQGGCHQTQAQVSEIPLC
jgi:hypothetical protein